MWIQFDRQSIEANTAIIIEMNECWQCYTDRESWIGEKERKNELVKQCVGKWKIICLSPRRYQLAMLLNLSLLSLSLCFQLCSPRESCSPPRRASIMVCSQQQWAPRQWWTPALRESEGEATDGRTEMHQGICATFACLLYSAYSTLVVSTVGQASALASAPAEDLHRLNLFKPVNSFPLHRVHWRQCTAVRQGSGGEKKWRRGSNVGAEMLANTVFFEERAATSHHQQTAVHLNWSSVLVSASLTHSILAGEASLIHAPNSNAAAAVGAVVDQWWQTWKLIQYSECWVVKGVRKLHQILHHHWVPLALSLCFSSFCQ